jgi:hypothetical protein
METITIDLEKIWGELPKEPASGSNALVTVTPQPSLQEPPRPSPPPQQWSGGGAPSSSNSGGSRLYVNPTGILAPVLDFLLTTKAERKAMKAAALQREIENARIDAQNKLMRLQEATEFKQRWTAAQAAYLAAGQPAQSPHAAQEAYHPVQPPRPPVPPAPLQPASGASLGGRPQHLRVDGGTPAVHVHIHNTNTVHNSNVAHGGSALAASNARASGQDHSGPLKWTDNLWQGTHHATDDTGALRYAITLGNDYQYQLFAMPGDEPIEKSDRLRDAKRAAERHHRTRGGK